ncbi:flagellar hook-length control protein FliK [Anaerosporobacter sp.]|uniref:flagellar hook-length control protein FliK n=1 Tax=Anaerosporobacter sp. TaxID=1872529 RepID=UPI00286EE5B5|nr:flagellar hook-length control protein FliK [Anaerosporobacter sp.]
MNFSSQSYQVGNGKGTNNSLSLHSLQGTSNSAYANNSGTFSLGQLSQGQVFQGTVVDIRDNQVAIQIDDQTVQAKFQDMVNVCIGETLNFVVRDNTGKQVTIAPYQEQIGNPTDGTIYKALEGAGLAATDKNLDIVATLLEHGMSVDKQTITTFISASLRYPDIPLTQFVDMMKNNMPLTNANIDLWSAFLGEKEDFSSNLQQVMQELPDAIRDSYMNGDLQAVKQLLDTILMSDKTLSSEASQADTEKSILEVVKGQLEQEHDAKAMEDILKSDSFSDAVTKELTDKWGIKPEQLQAETLQNVTTHMEEQMRAFQNISFQNPDIANQLQQALQFAMQNITTTQQMNQQMAQAKGGQNAFDMLYTQLPLKLKGQLNHSDLYVYRNKQNASDSSKNMSLLLHLDMEYLGDIDIMVKTQDYRMNAMFSLSDEEAYNIVEKHLPELERQLTEKGYFFTASATKKERSESKVQELFEDENRESAVKRYSFDVRA